MPREWRAYIHLYYRYCCFLCSAWSSVISCPFGSRGCWRCESRSVGKMATKYMKDTVELSPCHHSEGRIPWIRFLYILLVLIEKRKSVVIRVTKNAADNINCIAVWGCETNHRRGCRLSSRPVIGEFVFFLSGFSENVVVTIVGFGTMMFSPHVKADQTSLRHNRQLWNSSLPLRYVVASSLFVFSLILARLKLPVSPIDDGALSPKR